MYNIVVAEGSVRVPPNLTKMEVEDAIKEVLNEKYAGRYFSNLGFIVNIIEAKPISKGTVIIGDPNIYYKTKYKMLVFTIEPNEVYRAVVKDVTDFGAFVILGPFEALLHQSQIAKERFSFDKKNRVFVDRAGKKKIKQGDVLYVKVSTVSIKDGSSEAKISVTMRSEGLGNINWFEVKKEKKKGGKK